MYPQRNPVYTVGPYTVHQGKLSADDSRSHWIEGPAGDGVKRPIASCWNLGDAARLADSYNQNNT